MLSRLGISQLGISHRLECSAIHRFKAVGGRQRENGARNCQLEFASSKFVRAGGGNHEQLNGSGAGLQRRYPGPHRRNEALRPGNGHRDLVGGVSACAGVGPTRRVDRNV